MNKREAQKAETREKLIAEARRQFHHQGYEEVTTRSVAKGVRMSTGAIYAHFTDKAGMFEAAMGRPAPDISQFLARVASLCAGYPGDVGALSGEAEGLRRHLIGGHG